MTFCPHLLCICARLNSERRVRLSPSHTGIESKLITVNHTMTIRSVAKVLWTCVLQVQRKFQSDSVHVAPMETAGISTQFMETLNLRGTCSWLGECKKSQKVGYLCSCPRISHGS